MDGGEIALVSAILGIIAIKIFRGPIGDAIAHRIANRHVAPDETTSLRVEQLEARLAEVEERLDFTERLLAKARQHAELPEGTET
jgi:hypothetical protein